MTPAEQRRDRLGPAAVEAAQQSARDAVKPGQQLLDAIAVLLAVRQIVGADVRDTPHDAA